MIVDTHHALSRIFVALQYHILTLSAFSPLTVAKSATTVWSKASSRITDRRPAPKAGDFKKTLQAAHKGTDTKRANTLCNVAETPGFIIFQPDDAPKATGPTVAYFTLPARDSVLLKQPDQATATLQIFSRPPSRHLATRLAA